MSRWNEETKTFTDRDGDKLVVCGDGGNWVQTVRRGDVTSVALCDGTEADRESLARAIWPECPETTPAPFKTDAAFEDVMVGDRVRVTYEGGEPIEFTVDDTLSGNRFGAENVYSVWARHKPHYTIDILSRPGPVFPRTVPASEAHEHVGSRVTVEGDGYTITGSLKKASHLAVSDRWLLFVTIPALDRETTLNIPATHPITLEAPADAGASVVGGA